jgi:hypothetical protein
MKIDAELTIDPSRFGDTTLIESRVSQLPNTEQGSFRTALSYLYLPDGPVNLPRGRLLVSESYLDAAERLVIRWLYTRTNGSERKNYGRNALLAARAAQYRCESCGFADVRVLNLDHVHGRDSEMDEFACLCANCHTIKSRANEWSGPGQT